ncbi:hypothetical protein [Chlamydia sp.]|uniref:hypothetical protein n=1 Tax=Chlamydia sp. TaxID=35827 RepID=UPI0025BFBF19|nr:hypothetical protein [Chlamydia sp.]MBQ8498428.1 hypothetical protein [Chlamydia sp.]
MGNKKDIVSSSIWNRNQVIKKVLLNTTETGIETTPGIIANGKKITQLQDPTDTTDAVTLKYLKDNYTKENDPNPGFLPTTGGTMTGDINMQGNTITDLVMYTNGQKDPVDDSAVTIDYVNQQATVIKTNDKITQVVSKLSDINSQVGTLEELLGITEGAEAQTNAEFLKTSGGTVYGNIDMSDKTISDLGTPTNKDTKSAINVEFVQAKITSPQMAFLKNNDKELSNITVSEYFDWLQNPNPTVPDPAPSPTPPSPPTTPIITSIYKYGAAPSGNTETPSSTTSTSSETTSPATTSDPILPNSTFSEKSPLWDEFFSFSESSRSEMIIQKTGILTFFMQGTWEHPSNSQPSSTDSISLELTVSSPSSVTTTTTATPGTPSATNPKSSLPQKHYIVSSTATQPTPTKVDSVTRTFSLASGQSCTLQIPIQAERSILKLKYNNPNNNTGGNTGSVTTTTTTTTTSGTSASGINIQHMIAATDSSTQPTSANTTTIPIGITLKSFAWSLVLTPGETTKETTTSSPTP